MGSGAVDPAPTGPGRPPRRAGAGVPTREGRGVGSQPGNRALGQRGSLQAAVPPPGRGGRRPRVLRGLGRAQLARLGLELAARDAPGGQSLPAPLARGCALTLWVQSLVSPLSERGWDSPRGSCVRPSGCP